MNKNVQHSVISLPFYQGLELDLVFSTLTRSSLAALGLMVRTPIMLRSVKNKGGSKASLTKTMIFSPFFNIYKSNCIMMAY